MANTFVKIASVTVGSGGASSIDFTSIPSTYTDLCIKLSTRTTRTGATLDTLNVIFNSNISGYTYKELFGSGSAAGSAGSASNRFGYTSATGSTSNTFGSADLYIPNYAGSNNKSASGDSVAENNATEAYSMLSALLWSNTAAITSISINCLTTFVQYSTATLYGIKNS